MKYFGTDGIRGIVNETLNKTLLSKVAKAIVLYFKNTPKKILLVGNDSRISSDYILAVLSTTLLKNGIQIHNIGVCSSPCLAFLTQKYKYPLGLMLSASHNPAEYNGLKFFNNLGEKVSDKFEEEFEILMDKKISLKNDCFACLKNTEELKKDYINHLKKLKKFNFPIILDCANGGVCDICKQVFPKSEKINIKSDGKNINLNSGCTHIEMLKSLCVKKQKIGFAFDGDGDRIHIVDTDGTIVNGDKILHILSKFFLRSGDICVGTIYSNKGLEKALQLRHIDFKRSDVGDKNVVKMMKETNSILGGEDSGHIILKKFMNTGDGVMIAIIVGNLLQLSKKTLKLILMDYPEHFQMRKNIKMNENEIKKILNDENMNQIINKSKQLDAKIIIRPSGTEPLLRLFVEHDNYHTAKGLIEKIYDEIILVNHLE